MKIVNYLILVLFAGLMIFGSLHMPMRGDLNASMNLDTSPVGSPGASNYYIRNSKTDSHTDNMVTVILADWRGYDTLGEETVILTAGLVCYLLLRKRKHTHDA